jgi:hypothetical protein
MGHSVQPIASTSAATCVVVMVTAEGRAAGAELCRVERRGGCRSMCPTSWSIIFFCTSQQKPHPVTPTAAEKTEGK